MSNSPIRCVEGYLTLSLQFIASSHSVGCFFLFNSSNTGMGIYIHVSCRRGGAWLVSTLANKWKTMMSRERRAVIDHAWWIGPWLIDRVSERIRGRKEKRRTGGGSHFSENCRDDGMTKCWREEEKSKKGWSMIEAIYVSGETARWLKKKKSDWTELMKSFWHYRFGSSDQSEVSEYL